MESGVRHFQETTRSLQTRDHCRAVAVFSAADLGYRPQRTCYSVQLLFSKGSVSAPIDKQSDLCTSKFEGKSSETLMLIP